MKNYKNYCLENNFTVSEYSIYLLMVILPTYNRLSEYLDISKNYVSKNKMLEIFNKYLKIYKENVYKDKNDRYSTIRINTDCKKVVEEYLKDFHNGYKGFKLTQTLTQLHKFNYDFIKSKQFNNDFTKSIGDDD